VAESPITPMDQMFQWLDGRDLAAGGSKWRIEVYGVREDHAHRWIQLALVGPRHYALTLKLALTDGPQPAILALAEWVADPQDACQILEVGRRPHEPRG
jgi:hypothetical protein